MIKARYGKGETYLEYEGDSATLITLVAIAGGTYLLKNYINAQKSMASSQLITQATVPCIEQK